MFTSNLHSVESARSNFARARSGSVLLGMVLALMLLPALPALEPGHAKPAQARADRIIIRATENAAPAALQRLQAGLGLTTTRQFTHARGGTVLKLPPGLSVQQALTSLRQSGLVAYAEPDYLLQPLIAPNDFQYLNQDQWNLHNTGIYGGVSGADIMAEAGWDLQREAPDIIVAVVDSGVRYTHEDLAANMWTNPGETGLDSLGRDKRTNGVDDDGDGYIDDVYGVNVLTGSGNPMDDWGHGTHVAGILGGVGNNGVGIAGVAWRIKIMAVKFIDANAQYSVSDAVTALDYARVHGAKIVTASWGGYAFDSSALRDAIAALRSSGIILAAAAGNDNNDNDVMPLYPASYDFDNIIAVAATDRRDDRASYSNYGARTVDLGAPGSPVFSTWAGSDRDYRYLEGTSMAAPHVAGTCALLWTRFPGDTYQQIIQRIVATADPLPALNGKTRSNGRLNLAAALASGSAPPPPPASTLAAPTNLGAAAAAASTIALTWSDNSSSETGFEIQRSTDNTTFIAVTTVGANVTSATIANLSAATTYYFRVRAVQDTTTSGYSNTASATTPATSPPPSGSWQSADIGAVAAMGSGSESGGVFTIRGSGADIWDAADEFRFHYQTLTGDGEIVARLTGLTNTNSWAKAGVMLRESLAANSRHALMCVTAANGTAFQRRTDTGLASASTSGTGGSTLPRWVRLVRSGSNFTASESGNGSTWTQVGAVTLTMPSTIYAGLAVTSHNDGTLCSATFDSVVMTNAAAPPPSGVNAPTGLTAAASSSSQIDLAWVDNSTNETGFQVERSTDQQNFGLITTVGANVTTYSDAGRTASTTYFYRVRAIAGTILSSYSATASATTFAAGGAAWVGADIGNVGLAGSTTTTGITVTVRGSGADIWDGADAFHFAYRAMTGDCTVEAQVSTLTNTNSWAKAGVMIRESLAANARNVFACSTPATGVFAQVRSVTGGTTASQPGTQWVSPPRWVRLVRSGTRITAFESSDGATWTTIGAYDLGLGTTVYVGLAVTSHDNSQLNAATFSSAAAR